MGLSETVTSLILVKADSSQAKADLKSLRGAEKTAAKERLAEIEATNKGIDAQIAGWAKFAVGIGAAVGAFKLAQHAAKAYLEDVRLQAAAGSANIERLKAATHGLVEADNLLAFAGKAQHGVWKLNQQEMERVLAGAHALRKTMGVELKPTIDALTEAMAKGSTRALKEFGIEAKDKQGALRELDKVVQSLGGNTSLAGDATEAAGVKLADALDDIAGALGRLVVALTPAIEALADFATSIADAMTGTLSVVANNPQIKQQIELARELNKLAAETQALVDPGGDIPEATLFAEWDKQKAMSQRLFRAIMSGRMAPKGGKRGGSIDDGRGGGITGYERSPLAFAPAGDPLTGLGGDLGGGGAIDALGMKPGGVEEGMAARARELLRMQAEAEQRKNLFESIFGTPQTIDATAMAVYGAAKAFQLLEAAATAALDAFITGQMSMAQAVKAAIAQGLKAVAIDASIQALKNTAYGFAALATGPIGGVSAGGFFKAAALFGGVAVAAGAGAKAAYSAGWAGGGSAGGAPAGTSAGGYIGGGANGHTGGTSNTVIYVTGDAYRMSQAEREHRISDAARRGQQKRSRNVGGNF